MDGTAASQAPGAGPEFAPMEGPFALAQEETRERVGGGGTIEATSMTKEDEVNGGSAIDKVAMEGYYRRLRRRLTDWLASKHGRAFRFADQLLLLPDLFHLMVRLGLDRRVPRELRIQAGSVLAYVILPLDLLPEAMIGPLGLTDDLLLIALMTRRLLASVPAEVVLSHWAGRSDLLLTIQELFDLADEMVGERIWKRLQRLIGRGDR